MRRSEEAERRRGIEAERRRGEEVERGKEERGKGERLRCEETKMRRRG